MTVDQSMKVLSVIRRISGVTKQAKADLKSAYEGKVEMIGKDIMSLE